MSTPLIKTPVTLNPTASLSLSLDYPSGSIEKIDEFFFTLFYLCTRIKISINIHISIIRFYKNIKNINKILIDIFIKISIWLKFFIF